MKYQKINKDQLFIQDSSSGPTFLMIKENGAQFIINETGRIIVEMVYNYDNTDDILEILKERFSDVEEGLLEQDLNDIINTLLIYNIIKANNDDGNGEKMNPSRCSAVGEDEYNTVATFINEKASSCNCNISASVGKCDAIGIRTRVMTNSEFFYKYTDTDNSIHAVISIIPNYQSSVVTVASLIYDGTIEEKKYSEILNNFLSYIKASMISPITKIRVIVSEQNRKKPTQIIQLLEDCSFKVEAVLKREIGEDNTYFYSYFME